MAQSGTGQTAHTKVLIFAWATGTTLAAAIAAQLATLGTTWGAFFGSGLNSPMLRMPLVRIYTTAADGTLTANSVTAPLPTSTWFGPLTVEDTSVLTYTGSASAKVLLEC